MTGYASEGYYLHRILAALTGVSVDDVPHAPIQVETAGRTIPANAAVSGKTVVTTAGTEVALGTAVIKGPLAVKALTTNTGLVYVGNDGTGAVSSTTGYPLVAGDVHIFNFVNSLAALFVDSAVNGEGVAWAALDV